MKKNINPFAVAAVVITSTFLMVQLLYITLSTLIRF